MRSSVCLMRAKLMTSFTDLGFDIPRPLAISDFRPPEKFPLMHSKLFLVVTKCLLDYT